LGEHTKLEISNIEGVSFFTKLIRVNPIPNEDGTFDHNIIAIEDNEIIVDKTITKATKEVVVFKNEDFFEKDEQEVSASAWYDDLPCVANGCCTFVERDGLKLKTVKYNWCGAGCGSGTPINAADTCCRTHDYCYGSFTSYPGRCKCDSNFINCLANTSDPGSSIMRQVFKLKMNNANC
jgi:hypothetical protein